MKKLHFAIDRRAHHASPSAVQAPEKNQTAKKNRKAIALTVVQMLVESSTAEQETVP